MNNVIEISKIPGCRATPSCLNRNLNPKVLILTLKLYNFSHLKGTGVGINIFNMLYNIFILNKLSNIQVNRKVKVNTIVLRHRKILLYVLYVCMFLGPKDLLKFCYRTFHFKSTRIKQVKINNIFCTKLIIVCKFNQISQPETEVVLTPDSYPFVYVQSYSNSQINPRKSFKILYKLVSSVN